VFPFKRKERNPKCADVHGGESVGKRLNPGQVAKFAGAVASSPSPPGQRPVRGEHADLLTPLIGESYATIGEDLAVEKPVEKDFFRAVSRTKTHFGRGGEAPGRQLGGFRSGFHRGFAAGRRGDAKT
jgi:hypothetical protein